MGIYIVIITLLLASFFFILIKFLDKLWWKPNRIQKVMASQGIKGPSYKFLHGTTKELLKMRNEAMATPMELSHDIVSSVMPHTYSWMKLYGKCFLHWMGPQPELVITDPDLIKVVLNNKDGAFQKSKIEGHATKLLGDGLVTSKGEKWQRQRKLANLAFHVERLKDMTPAMTASVEMMLARWRNHEGKEIDATGEFKLLTSEVISRTAFGSSYLEGQRIFDLLMKLTAIVHRTAFKIRIPGMGKLVKTSNDVEAERLNQAMRESVIKLVRKREETAASGGEAATYGGDFLGFLVSAYHSEDKSKKISLDDVIGECKTFYLGGQETTSILLSWTILLLAMNQDWQDKARAEVLDLFGNQNPNPNGISKLATMGMIINETLRLYSPAVQISRTTSREVKIGELTLPPQMRVAMPILYLHHDTNTWGDDSHLFKPERFAQGVAKATNNQIASYIPFGLGARFCVGLNFATNEVKIALSMILQRYRFTLSHNYVHSPVQLGTLTPQHGVQIVLHAL